MGFHPFCSIQRQNKPRAALLVFQGFRGVFICVPYEFIMCSLTLGSSGFVEDPSSDSYILSRTKVSVITEIGRFETPNLCYHQTPWSWILCMNPC